jgi:hypothetical protein
MNTHDPRHDATRGDDDSPDPALLEPGLRFALRGLRRDAAPATDLWPGIAARLASTPQRAASPARRPVPAWRRLAPLATAASFALAIGLAWQMRPAPPADDAARVAQQALVTEADALTREYQAALTEVGPVSDGETMAALRELDRSAAQIRTALAREPGARFLLDRLQHIYARRLALTQRLALT